MEPELVADARCQIAEGPIWHPDEVCLYWTDIPAGQMFRFDPADDSHEVVYEGDVVGGIAVQTDGSLLLLGEGGSVRMWRDGDIKDVVLTEIANERHTRFNDLIVDSAGRVISGTMAARDEMNQVSRYGNLYCLEGSGQHRVLLGDMASPNGMGFTPDMRQMYLTDSFFGIQAIDRLDYDRATGTLSNRKRFHQTPQDGSDGRPDGMTVDTDGCVWSARWGGGAVVRLRPDGTECARFKIPVANVSSVTFGGADYTDLYITTAQGQGDASGEPGAGGVFRLRSVGQGRPEFRSSIGL